jgi:hypothetical protein
MKTHRYHDIALATGGSHYPMVGGHLLEKFGDLLLESIFRQIQDCDYLSGTAQESLIKDIRSQFQK